MITIVLADDHRMAREGIRALLEAEKGLSVVGEARDGVETVEVVGRLKPDVLVLDLMMPGLSGFEVMPIVVKSSPKTRVIVLSMYVLESYVVEAFRKGASAYVVKEAGATELVWAIRESAVGRRYVSSPLSERPLETYLRRARETYVDPYDTLTRREREVMHLAAEGLTSAEIAERLSISPRTVETHRSRVLHKLGLRGPMELVRYALRRGILPLEEHTSASFPRARNHD